MFSIDSGDLTQLDGTRDTPVEVAKTTVETAQHHNINEGGMEICKILVHVMILM